MKIAIFSDNFFPEISGISDSVVLLARELADKGHEIHFFAPWYSKKDFGVANLADEELQLGDNIKIHRFWSLPYLGSPTKQARIVLPIGLRLLKYRKEKFDVIYSQSPFGMGIEALLMSRFFGIPLVGTNHTPISEFTQYLPLNNCLFDWFGLKFYCWYYNRCSFVSAPYQGLLDEMKQYGLKSDCFPISNPIDLNGYIQAIANEKRSLKDKYELSSSTIFYAGRLAIEKRVDVIIKAVALVAKEFPEINLAITGHGNAQADLQELVEKLGIKKQVKFFGRVDDEVLIDLFKAADIFTIMSTAETQSISLMKAMAVGLPSIVANARALPTHINDQNGFVVPVGDEKVLAEKIITLLNDSSLCYSLGQGGISYVKQFSSDKISVKWEKIFKNFTKK